METWKSIKGYEERYSVSDHGRVKNHKTGRYLKCTKEGHGYPAVKFYFNGMKKTYKVHQLVAMAFLGHLPCGYNMVVDHINNIKMDNKLENLQLISPRENSSKDAVGASKYVGVFWTNQKKMWGSRIQIEGKNYHLKLSKSERECSDYYNRALSILKTKNRFLIDLLIKHLTPNYKSNYKGVYQSTGQKKWKSSIWLDGRLKTVGTFNSELEAHLAYQKAKSLISLI